MFHAVEKRHIRIDVLISRVMIKVVERFCCFSEFLVEGLRARIEELATENKFVVYFCALPIPFFKELSFIVDILYRTDFPAFFICHCHHRSRVAGVCHVPEVSTNTYCIDTCRWIL